MKKKLFKKEAVRRKLANMKEYLKELETLSKRDLEGYLGNFEYRRAVERLIQIIVETAVDCNNLIVISLGERPPIGYKESFLKLAKLKVISPEFASSLIPFVSLRNRIVHEYEEIKDELVFASIRQVLGEFAKYQKMVAKFISKGNI